MPFAHGQAVQQHMLDKEPSGKPLELLMGVSIFLVLNILLVLASVFEILA